MRLLLRTVGIIAIAFGVLFFLQGLDVLHWPASSFMLAKTIWCLWGGLIALFGLGVVWATWRR
jgi:hypothetical protein